MTFTIGTVTRCSGGNHVEIPVTVGGNTVNLSVMIDEINWNPSNLQEAKEAVIARLRSAAKEAVAGNPTFAQVRTALEGKTFKV